MRVPIQNSNVPIHAFKYITFWTGPLVLSCQKRYHIGISPQKVKWRSPMPVKNISYLPRGLFEYNTDRRGWLMTMMTSFSNASDRIDLQLNTIKNWAQFMPSIQPILFSTFKPGQQNPLSFYPFITSSEIKICGGWSTNFSILPPSGSQIP